MLNPIRSRPLRRAFTASLLALTSLVASSRTGSAQPERPLSVGSVIQQNVDAVTAGDSSDRVWRLRVERPTTVWVSLETADFIPDLRVERWRGGDVDAFWDRLGFNEYVRFEAAGDYRVAVRFDPASKRRGAFVLRVASDAPRLGKGAARRAAERAYYRAALGRAGVTDTPSFHLRILEGLIEVLRSQSAWGELVDTASEAASIYERYGRYGDRARLLEERADAEAERNRLEAAVDAGEAAVSAWIRAGEFEQAASRLAWTCASSMKLPTRSTRMRIMRVYRLAARSESPRHALQSVASVFQEEGLIEQAMIAFARAALLHERDGDERSYVGAVVRLVDLLVEHEPDLYASFAVPETLRELVRDHLKERLFAALESRDAAVARTVTRRGRTVLLASGAKAEAANVVLELGYVFKELRARDSRAEAKKAFEDARVLAEQAGDGSVEARALNELGLLVSSTDPDAAVDFYFQAFQKATACGDREARSWAVFNLGHSFQAKKDDRRAADWYARIESLPRRDRGSLGFARFLRSVIGVFERAGRPAGAMRFAEHVAWIYRSRGHDRSLARAELRLGELAWRAGEDAAARAAFQRAIHASAKVKATTWFRAAAGRLCLSLCGFGRHR